jgi:hypothetical protein
MIRQALGSDLWPITWADDGNLYTSWGDGIGFGAVDSEEQWGPDRAAVGFSRIEGFPPDFTAKNVWGGKDAEAMATFPGKVHGIISIDGVIYMVVTEQDAWMRGKVGKSIDYGRTWTFESGAFTGSDWTFDEPGGAFAAPAILQFGRNYEGALDDFVYLYSEKVREVFDPDILLARVPKDRIMDRAFYEFFAGTNSKGEPVWTKDIQKAEPVFTDPNGVGWGMLAIFHPQTGRYLLTVRHDNTGGWGIFDAPKPWGPWTTVAYYDNWIDSERKFMFSFNQKWMDPDGRTMWMIFSGSREYDSFNVIKATLMF